MDCTAAAEDRDQVRDNDLLNVTGLTIIITLPTSDRRSPFNVLRSRPPVGPIFSTLKHTKILHVMWKPLASQIESATKRVLEF